MLILINLFLLSFKNSDSDKKIINKSCFWDADFFSLSFNFPAHSPFRILQSVTHLPFSLSQPWLERVRSSHPFQLYIFPHHHLFKPSQCIILSSICLSPKSSFLRAEPILARSRRSFDSWELDSKAEILEFIPEVILSTQNLLFFCFVWFSLSTFRSFASFEGTRSDLS